MICSRRRFDSGHPASPTQITNTDTQTNTHLFLLPGPSHHRRRRESCRHPGCKRSPWSTHCILCTLLGLGSSCSGCGDNSLCSATPPSRMRGRSRRCTPFTSQRHPGALRHRVADRNGNFGRSRGETRDRSRAQNRGYLSAPLSPSQHRSIEPLDWRETQKLKDHLGGLFVNRGREPSGSR